MPVISVVSHGSRMATIHSSTSASSVTIAGRRARTASRCLPPRQRDSPRRCCGSSGGVDPPRHVVRHRQGTGAANDEPVVQDEAALRERGTRDHRGQRPQPVRDPTSWSRPVPGGLGRDHGRRDAADRADRRVAARCPPHPCTSRSGGITAADHGRSGTSASAASTTAPERLRTPSGRVTASASTVRGRERAAARAGVCGDDHRGCGVTVGVGEPVEQRLGQIEVVESGRMPATTARNASGIGMGAGVEQALERGVVGRIGSGPRRCPSSIGFVAQPPRGVTVAVGERRGGRAGRRRAAPAPAPTGARRPGRGPAPRRASRDRCRRSPTTGPRRARSWSGPVGNSARSTVKPQPTPTARSASPPYSLDESSDATVPNGASSTRTLRERGARQQQFVGGDEFAVRVGQRQAHPARGERHSRHMRDQSQDDIGEQSRESRRWGRRGRRPRPRRPAPGSDRRSAALTVPAPNRTSSGWAASGCTSRTHGNARSPDRRAGRRPARWCADRSRCDRPTSGTGREASSSATTASTTSGISASYSVFHQRGSRWWPESSSASRARPIEWTSTAARAGACRGAHSAGRDQAGHDVGEHLGQFVGETGNTATATRRQQVSAAVGGGQPRLAAQARRGPLHAAGRSTSLRANPGVGTRSSRWSAGSAATNDA